MTAPKTRHILLILLMALMIPSLACRLTTRTIQGEVNGDGGVEVDTAVTEPAIVPPATPATTDTNTAGDEFENLLNSLIHENDLADDLEDFPDSK